MGSVSEILNKVFTGTALTVSQGALSSTTDSVATSTVLVAPVTNQQTSNTSRVQLSASSTVPKSGIIVKALSTNTASVFVGDSTVTTALGYELTPGESVSFAPTNLTTLYVIGSNNTDKVCWNVL